MVPPNRFAIRSTICKPRTQRKCFYSPTLAWGVRFPWDPTIASCPSFCTGGYAQTPSGSGDKMDKVKSQRNHQHRPPPHRGPPPRKVKCSKLCVHRVP